MKRTVCAVGFAALCLTWVAPVAAQSDHLKCYKVKDPQAKKTYTADLGGLVPEPGCFIKVPAKLMCVPATKMNVTPMPPGGGATGTPNAFLCYAVKCPRAALPALSLHDQFGNRALQPTKASLLCAPAPAAGATTTTTTASTTTTTTVGCGNPSQACCPGNVCAGGGCCINAQCIVPGANCTAGMVCQSGTCVACGFQGGEPCCQTDTCAGGACCGQNGSCVPQNSVCFNGGACTNGSCGGCGGSGQGCCSGATCTAAGTVCDATTLTCGPCKTSGEACTTDHECCSAFGCAGAQGCF